MEIKNCRFVIEIIITAISAAVSCKCMKAKSRDMAMEQALTQRELEILKLVSEGCFSKQIADKLFKNIH
jgi:DNA-binding NarL/FixJ family response regulator